MKLTKSRPIHYKKIVQNSKTKLNSLNEKSNTLQTNRTPLSFISRNSKLRNKTEFDKDSLNPIKISIKADINQSNVNETLKRIKTYSNTISTSRKKLAHFKEKTNKDSTIFVMKNINYNKIYNINLNNRKKKSLDYTSLLNFTYNKPKTTSAFNIYKYFDKSTLQQTSFNRSFNNSFKNSCNNSYSKTNRLSQNNSFHYINTNFLSQNDNKKINLSNSKKKSKIQHIFIDFGHNNKRLCKYNSNNMIYNKNKCKINKSPTSFYKKTARKNNFEDTESFSKKSLSFYAINSNFILNLNDLIIFENKLNNIVSVLTVINSIKENNIINADDECKDFLIFYFESNLKGKFITIFNITNKIIVQSSINILLFCIILCYFFSINHLVDDNIAKIFTDILSLVKNNFLLYIKQLLIKQKNEKIFKVFRNSLIKNKIDKLNNEKEIVDKIFSNCQNLMGNGLQKIVSSYKKKNNLYSKEFVKVYNNISLIPENDFEEYFYKKLIYESENEFIFHINENNREIIELNKTNFNTNKKNLYNLKKSITYTSSLKK